MDKAGCLSGQCPNAPPTNWQCSYCTWRLTPVENRPMTGPWSTADLNPGKPMKASPTRREFLADVGRGMLIASVGSTLASDLGLAPTAFAAEGPDPTAALNFGDLESLVCLMQETPADKLLPKLTAELKRGTELRRLVAAGALANARTFGGEDYIG